MRITGLTLFVLAMAMAGCRGPCQQNLPPAQMLMHPGPGVDGPGPGVMQYNPGGMTQEASQIAFVGPEGMTVNWDVSAPGAFDSEQLICPGRYNFPQGALYRLKVSNVPGRPGVDLYPTLEVGPALPRTEAFLAHNAIPVQFTPEDFDQVLTGNFVTKVLYLPDPEFQELAVAGVETLVSTRLDPGVDPIVEADRRGAILAIVRLGNKDLLVPSPTMGPDGEIQRAAYLDPQTGEPCPPQGVSGGPLPMAVHGNASTMPMGAPISGVNGPQYGMPITGTPIGLAGPPHIPLGTPAGLQKHVIVNHTRERIPDPTSRVRLDVKEKPGFSYPKPAHHARIVERSRVEPGQYRQPMGNRHERNGEACPEGVCPTDESAPCPPEAAE
jgi:hypothetical protein